jgi:antitoxin component YwqK of YwqJK toxin-antitoxin module
MRLVVFLGYFIFSSFSIAASFDDLVEREGVYYQKSSPAPYTGQIDGVEKGLIRNGKKEGLWITFFSDGRALSKAYFKNGILNGPFESYQGNGDVRTIGNYKDGKRSGDWVTYQSSGEVWQTLSGTFIDGVKVGNN